MTKARLIVLTNPVEGREAEYNDWYDNRHIPNVLSYPGFKSAQRYKAVGDMEYAYAAIYEIEAEDPQAALDRVEAGISPEEVSAALDCTKIYQCIYVARGDEQVSK